MNRRERQAAILRLVQDRALSTQAELVQALQDEGHDVVQTTVSRDVAELGLVKVRAPSGRLDLRAARDGRRRSAARDRRRDATLRHRRRGGEQRPRRRDDARPGYASALAQAIDEGGHPSIAGTLAGDNTIFVAAKDGTTAQELQAELAAYLADGGHGMTLWSGRVGGSLDPAVWAFLHADDARLLPYDCEASFQHAQRLHAAGLLSDAELAEAEAQARRDRAGPGGLSRRGRGRAQRDRAAARRARPQDPRRPLAQRPGRSRVQALRARRLRGGARGDRRRSPSSSSRSPRPRPTRSCPATPTFSAASR